MSVAVLLDNFIQVSGQKAAVLSTQASCEVFLETYPSTAELLGPRPLVMTTCNARVHTKRAAFHIGLDGNVLREFHISGASALRALGAATE